MIPQLVERIRTGTGPAGIGTAGPTIPLAQARAAVLTADPLDLALQMEQVWLAFRPPPPTTLALTPARDVLMQAGQFAIFGPAAGQQVWDHLGYSYVLENSRAVQIIKKLVREFRSGEAVGLATPETQRWLDATEALLFGADFPWSAWLSTSLVRPDAEAGRRNAYWRLFGLDLAFGGEDNRPPVYDKASAANAGFVALFEELLYEVWQAISNLHNFSGADQTDNDRIYRLAEALQLVLTSRRKHEALAREELASATVLGWIDVTLSEDTSVVVDAGAQATNAASRLINLGNKVGLPAHSRSSALFSMCAELSLMLRTIETGVVTGPEFAWILYRDTPPPGQTTKPIGNECRRVITEWSAATGKDLKGRARPAEVKPRRLVSVQ